MKGICNIRNLLMWSQTYMPNWVQITLAASLVLPLSPFFCFPFLCHGRRSTAQNCFTTFLLWCNSSFCKVTFLSQSAVRQVKVPFTSNPRTQLHWTSNAVWQVPQCPETSVFAVAYGAGRKGGHILESHSKWSSWLLGTLPAAIVRALAYFRV